jgi:hypothetical protein
MSSSLEVSQLISGISVTQFGETEKEVFIKTVEQSTAVSDVALSVDITSVSDASDLSAIRRSRNGSLRESRSLLTSSINVVYYINYTALASSISTMKSYYNDITTNLNNAVTQNGTSSFTYYLQKQAALSNCSAMMYTMSNEIFDVSPMLPVSQMHQPTVAPTTFTQGFIGSVKTSTSFKGLGAIIAVSVVVLVIAGLYFYLKDKRSEALRQKLKKLKTNFSNMSRKNKSIESTSNRESDVTDMTNNPLSTRIFDSKEIRESQMISISESNNTTTMSPFTQSGVSDVNL